MQKLSTPEKVLIPEREFIDNLKNHGTNPAMLFQNETPQCRHSFSLGRWTVVMAVQGACDLMPLMSTLKHGLNGVKKKVPH